MWSSSSTRLPAVFLTKHMIKEKPSISHESLDSAGRPDYESSHPLRNGGRGNCHSAIPICSHSGAHRTEQQVADVGIWTGFWSISRRAIPAMMIVAALSLGLSFYFTGNKKQPATFSVDAYLGTNESGVDNLLFAERRPLTRDEVLARSLAEMRRELGR